MLKKKFADIIYYCIIFCNYREQDTLKKLKNLRYQKEFDTRTLMSQDLPQEGSLLADSGGKSEEKNAEVQAKSSISVRDAIGKNSLESSAGDDRDAEDPAAGTRKVADLKEIAEAKKKNPDNSMTQVYEPRPLTPDDDIYEDILEHFASAPTKPKYWFEEFGDYWSCSCGHINDGDICTNCGLEKSLLRSLFILHRPEGATENPNKKLRDMQGASEEQAGDTQKDERSVSAEKKENKPPKQQEPREKEKAPEPERPASDEKPLLPAEVTEKKKPVSRRRLIIIISVVLAVLIALSICAYMAYVHYAAPAKKYDEAQQLQADGRYAEAIKVYESLGDYEDSEAMIRNCWISIGDGYYMDGQYEEALAAYYTASDMKESKELSDKINQAKFGFVEANQSEGGDTFLQYMTELRSISYPGIQEIYDAYYAWHIKIIANTSEDDFSNDVSTASRSDTVYFHVLLSGGEPSETLELYYEITWPNGSSQVYSLDSRWKSGSQISARFQYPIPLFGREGTLKFQLYDKNSNQLLGTDSVELKN